MSGSALPAGTRVRDVALTVSDLERTSGFYKRVLGLEEVRRGDAEVELGAGGQTIVRLVHDPEAQPPRGTARLYHFAVLFSSRADLARALLRLAGSGWPVEGASDHLVSEAIYLSDPERNGIELYRDRPRDEWRYSDGEIQMVTLPLDIPDLLAEARRHSGGGAAGADAPAPLGTTLGHIHLHVNDLQAAERFYTDVLGLELMTRYGGQASFLAAGGYHHHVGINTWGMQGARPAESGALGLRWYGLVVPDVEALAGLEARLEQAGWAYERTNGSLSLRDPAGHALRVSVG